ncbi:GNAT family N-acetyltransferase [Streptomyces sp. NPDC051569]|uniref:GNAT family N-acetyltransferase n=1 Tax=Streptomyces sp. NPDC051569 TaxID=3365661 RepID=UPI00379764E4
MSLARRATSADAAELVRLRRQVMLDSYHGPDTDTGRHPAAVTTLRERLTDPDGDLAAFAPDLRSRGHSRSCVEALLGRYRTRDVRVIDPHASPDGEALYTSLGFARTPDPSMRLRFPGPLRS